MVLKRGVEPGESEFSHGKGMMAPTELDYEPNLWDQLVAYRRMDSTDSTSTPDYRVSGNPDHFGAGLPQVREGKKHARANKRTVDVSRPGGILKAPFRTGVFRAN